MAAMHFNTLNGCFVDCLRSMSSILSFHYFPLVVQTFLFSTHLTSGGTHVLDTIKLFSSLFLYKYKNITLSYVVFVRCRLVCLVNYKFRRVLFCKVL